MRWGGGGGGSRGYRGQVALVTGAASGIGRALATELARRGAKVILADRDQPGAEAAAASITASGGIARGVRLDVAHREDFAAVVADVIAREGRLDLLFNNAGIGIAAAFEDTTDEDWRRSFEVNLYGCVHGIAAAYPHMAARGSGAIVHTASGAGLLPRPFMTAYAAAKHAVVGLTTALAAEAHARGVRVHAVCPGYIATGIQRATTYRNLDHERLLAAIPVRPMSAERCARVVLRGVARGRTIIPVTALAWFEWLLYRLSPELVIRIARWRAGKFREHAHGAGVAPAPASEASGPPSA